MPIRQHLPEYGCFEPEAIVAMSKALDEACTVLRLHAGDQSGREVIAARIIDFAWNGVGDEAALRDRALCRSR
jgi:hypothetical protein